MATRGVRFVEQHFFLSNRLVQLVLGLHRNQSSNNQLLLLSTIIAYVLPIIIYQLYQLFTMDFNLTTAVIELRKIIAAFIMLSAYSNANFHFVTMNLLLIRFKHDCEHLSDEMELNIMEKYTKQTKIYAYAIVVLFSFYVISITSSCTLNVLLYLFGTLNDNQLTLPIPINNHLNSGAWKIQQQFTNDSKYMYRTLCSQKSQQEFHWIIDVIKCYRNVTECQIPFYLLPTKTQKLLLFMIARSMKPCMLSIGGLFVSSHEVFSQKVCFDAAKVRYTIMPRRSQTSFEQHFLFSNRLTALVINPNRSLNNQLFLFCAITVYLFPIIVHQMKLIFARIECDFLQLVDEKLFNIIEKYTKQSKRYTYIIVVFFSLYIISMTFPSILNVLLYIFGVLDDAKLTLPFTDYDGLIVGPLYYNLLIYQLIGALILLTIGTSIYSSYLIYQLSEILHSLTETIECSINIFASTLVLYLNFYVGQRLLNHSNDVFDELCKIPFYNLSIKSQKLLLFMIMRSTKPCMLSIGKMFISSHKVFSELMYKALSFAMMYYNFN
ncbi:hypothetical protein HZH66_011397 [Vespula vulgaris]|uniref:Odorant receptor n=1 Tax=Vespula vulgaris TaxID=7454 RepID=A0A834MWE2_VESVU|nr:hypothetical protein HZH66_011397 [Vespula vulgaris]